MARLLVIAQVALGLAGLASPPPHAVAQAFSAAVPATVSPASAPPATPKPTWSLKPAVEVDHAGVYADQVLTGSNEPVPAIRLSDSPPFGQTLVLNRALVQQAIQQAGLLPPDVSLAGAVTLRVTRRSRVLHETELRERLTAAVREKASIEAGELELRLARAWTPLRVPDGPLVVEVLDLPPGGLSASPVIRFDLLVGPEKIGSWQTVLQARLWREIYVTRTALRRGQPLSDAELVRERRDVLTAREVLTELPGAEGSLEVGEYVPAGAPLTARALRARPVIRRGQTVTARIFDGTMNVSLKALAMEDGAIGQTIRLRNAQSQRDITGKVQDELTVQVLF